MESSNHEIPETSNSNFPDIFETGAILAEPDRVALQQSKALNTLKVKKLQAAVFNGSLLNVRKNPITYQYKFIDYYHQIRVLKIYPGHGDAALECRLLPITLDETPGQMQAIKYTALSYSWGQDTATHKVYMYDDDDLQRSFAKIRYSHLRANLLKQVSFTYIQNNLNKVLRQIRDEEEEIYVWSDALCIHQNDVSERSAQVARMHDIYMQAQDVIIWLGDADGKLEDNRMTFKFLKGILYLPFLEQYIERLERKEQEALDCCASVFRLMESDWFKRRWVIQELALASQAEVRRGDCMMPWLDFADAISLFMTKHKQIRRAHGLPGTYDASLNQERRLMETVDPKALPANIMVTANSNFFRKSNEGQIQQRLLSLELLVSSMLLAFEASDPKDTVFAVLQIAKDTFKTPSMDHQDAKQRWLRYAAWFSISTLTVFSVQVFDAAAVYQNTRARLLAVDTRFLIYNVGTDPDIRMLIRLVLQWCFLVILLLFILAICKYTFSFVRNGLEKLMLLKVSRKDTPLIDKRIEPKYEKCVLDVFGDFIEYCIETSDSLDVLCRHWAPEISRSEDGMTTSLPSWILPIKGHAFGGAKKILPSRINGDSLVGGSDSRGFYKASGSIRPSYWFGKNKVAMNATFQPSKPIQPCAETVKSKELQTVKAKELPQRFDGTLNVKGIQLCAIQHSAAIIGGVISERALELLGWKRGSDISESNLDQIWRTLVANRGPGGTNPPGWYRRVCQSCLEWYERQTTSHFSTSTLKMLSGTPPAKVEFLDRVQQVAWGKKCFRTITRDQQEIVGLVPPDSEAGDLICVLFGCSVPVVLRERKDTKTFEFIGECYVHGKMDGEAVESAPGGSKPRWFKLR